MPSHQTISESIQKKTALVFPGQGSQKMGMMQGLRADFPCASSVIEEAEDTLKMPLGRVMREGSEDELRQTIWAQPALLVSSWIVLTILREDFGYQVADICSCVAGHSLGEYSALLAAGSLTFSQALTLVKARAEAMTKAAGNNPGAMAAVLNIDVDEFLTAQTPQGMTCVVANDNTRGQVVISGHSEALIAVSSWIKAQGGKAIPLRVSGAFHSPLMQEAADAMHPVLKNLTLAAPVCPVITNVSATPRTDAAMIRQDLQAQIIGRVCWRETMDTMRANGVETLIEVGSGRVLGGLAKRHDETWKLFSSDDTASVKVLISYLEGCETSYGKG